MMKISLLRIFFFKPLWSAFINTCFYSILLVSSSLKAGPAVVAEKDLPKANIAENAVTTTPANQPPPKPEKSSVPQVGYDGGFFIKNADGNYKLLIGGYTQLDFNVDRDAGETVYGLRVRRARLIFDGNLFTPRFTYRIQLDLVNFKTSLLLDAYVDYAVLKKDLLNVRVGQQTVPYIRQHQISGTAQMFLERSLASLEFITDDDVDVDGDGLPDKLVKNGRDLGVKLHGMPFNKKLEYQVGIFDGHGTNTTNLNNDFLYMGRFVYNPFGPVDYSYEGDLQFHEDLVFFIGGAANYNVRGISNDEVLSMGGETGLKFKGFAATGEFFYRNTKPGDTLLATENDIGYYAQAGYFVIPKRMEVALRASQIFLEGPKNDQGEFQVGVNGFIYGNNLKLQTDYSYLPTNTFEGIENNQRFRLRLQTRF